MKGGKGGNGCVSFEVMRFLCLFIVGNVILTVIFSPGCKRASGGSGGRGGNVYLIADPEINSLKFQTFHYTASDGKHGGS